MLDGRTLGERSAGHVDHRDTDVRPAGRKEAMQRSKRIVIGVAQVAALAGCVTTSSIAPGQLARLDGFDTHDAARSQMGVESLDGHPMQFTRDSRLVLDVANQQAGFNFTSIHVQNDLFVGKTQEGWEVEVPLSAVRSAKVEQRSSAAAVVIAGSVVGGLLLVTILIALSANAGGASTPGRALRVKGRSLTAPLGRARGWTSALEPDLSTLSLPARDALARHWHETALGEHASVPAFSRLSMTLMALGAPSRLVDDAHRAAREEIGHARLAFSLASAYAGAPVAPGPLAALADAPAITVTSLRGLAAESLVDGCLMEGFAAAALRDAHARASDRAVRGALAIIASEEASHAQLAWEIVGWCADAEGPELCASLLPLVESAPVPRAPGDFAAGLEAELRAHGWVPAGAWRQLFAEARAAVAARLRTLGARRSSAAA
jgi:hypothetical protein